MRAPRASKFADPATPRRRTVIAAGTIMAASLLTILPIVTTFPFLPPFGLLVLLAWRLRAPEVLPVWAAAPLGLFDDLFSGNPLGSAMALWTIAVVAIDVLDSRLVWRDFWHDWLVAGAAILLFLVGARLAATPLSAHVDIVLLIQIVASLSLFPLVAMVCARIDATGRQTP